MYFDFETINSPIIVFNGCKPYQQIITQVSIIIDHNTKEKISTLTCKNLIVDTQKLDLNWFKSIVDSLLENIKNPTNIVSLFIIKLLK